ncbi:hypothetical protein FMUND_2242 [Fusarium mundagurra]|uniref:Uncharacterized protein n=1 Tax=Fusarium mundagurra TaxID=1567541 RepID=A0A8H5Z466_9HYPO|nr:hypothetical protein FMUND_2242 [Fusarium mundagurra]
MDGPSRLPAPGRVPDKRYSLADGINRIDAENEDEIFQLVTGLDEHVRESQHFRWQAMSTQKAQDRVRLNYRHFLQTINIINNDMTEEAIDKEMFLGDQEKITKQMKMFIMFVAKYGKGRAQGTRISYRGLVTYRNALVFWCNRMARIYNTSSLPNSISFVVITEAMRYATHAFQLTNTAGMAMSKVGLPELRQLIDFDMISAPNIEVAECHHLAWCIGRICAVRPGSLARSDNKPADSPQKPFLIWNDIELSRDHDGKFTLTITFRNLKTNSEELTKASHKAPLRSQLRCVIKSPQNTENLVFSVPHRLLAMAIRRGILCGIETVDQLFSSRAKYILIKPEFLDKPVFLAAGPRGLKITQEPMRATALTTYISLRGQKIGYADVLTFYSLRRRTANDLSRKIGKDAARSLMNHDPDSRTLEKYYLSLEDTLDVSGLALDEIDGDTAGHTEEMLKADSDLAIHVLTDERARKVHGPALNALMNQMMLGELVLEKARRNLTASEPIDEDESPSDEPSTVVDETTGLFIHDVEERHEQDLDDQINNAGDPGVIHRELDEGEPEADEDISYIEAAKAFMQLILSNTMSEYRNLRKDGIPCPQCQDDDTISQELKNKRYYDATHLYDHERSQLHLPKQKWARRVTLAFEASGDKRITCPYCKRLGKDSQFFHVKALVKHITYGRFGAEHDRLKRADGWYDDGWEKHPQSKSKTFRKNQERQRQVKMAALNIRYSQYEPAPAPVPHPTRAGIVFAPGSRPITRAGVKMVPAEEISKPVPIPDRYKSAIRVGDINEPFNVPKGLEGSIKTTRMKFPTIGPGQGIYGGQKGGEDAD